MIELSRDIAERRLSIAMKNGNELKPWLIFEYVSAILTDTVPWGDIPYHVKDEWYGFTGCNISCGYGNRDRGIDSANNYVAVQSKCKPNSSITMEELNNFYMACLHRQYASEKFNTKILTTVQNAKISTDFKRPLFKDVTKMEISKETIQKICIELKNREFENETVYYEMHNMYQDKIVDHYFQNRKEFVPYRISAPCGFGKTHVMVKIIKKFNGGKILILVPSLTLMEQTSKAFDNVSKVGTGYKINKKANVFVTVYNSIDKVKNINFDAIFVDEAHHIEKPELYMDDSYEDEEKEEENDEEENEEENDEEKKDDENDNTYINTVIQKIKNHKNVIMMSATIDNYDYKITEKEAIDAGLITDYQLVIPFFDDTPTRSDMALYLCDNKLRFSSVIAYSNSQNGAKEFHDECTKIGLSSCYIDCNTPKTVRESYFERFRMGEIQVISSVNTISEGVSLKNCNTALFLDKKSSVTALKQCVGRTMRNYPGKTQGYVILGSSEKEEISEYRRFVNMLTADNPIKKNSHKLQFEITNSIIKENYQKIYTASQLLGEKIYSMNRLTIEEKIDEFLKFVEKEKKIPTKKDNFSDEINMGKWWINCKNQDRLKKEPYKKLLVNEILKTDYEEYKNRPVKITLTSEQKIDEFLKFVEKKGKIPTRKDKFSDEISMGSWWITCKNKGRIEKEPHNKLLKNEILKKDYEKYKNRSKLTSEQKIDKFLKFVEKEGKIPTYKDKFSDEISMGNWWTVCKCEGRLEKEPHNKLLKNEILKKNYEEYKNRSVKTTKKI